MNGPDHSQAGTGFRCPECGEADLKITKAIELRPDARWSEITLQLVSCQSCNFEAIGVYKENNWGASEIVDHNGYRAPPSTRTRVSALIDACPQRSVRNCDCASCSTLSATDENGAWNWLEQAGVGERFPLRLGPSKRERPLPRPPLVPRLKPPSLTPRHHWGISPRIFRFLLLFFLLGASVGWYGEWSAEAGAWRVLHEDWSWPHDLATAGSAAYYAVSALLLSYLVGVCVTFVMDETRNAYRWLRGRG